ncbi:protein of unknown function [Denitratisoma oestradiolicum]|uniref:Uncharacterized protein n=1 Tax=Denitratisoma oestradiolicum TaxID=311182 RepID=A0A6S6YAH8_9PROT|nr:protein of unknown function [Denitratisoma oestradiolicum]
MMTTVMTLRSTTHHGSLQIKSGFLIFSESYLLNQLPESLGISEL